MRLCASETRCATHCHTDLRTQLTPLPSKDTPVAFADLDAFEVDTGECAKRRPSAFPVSPVAKPMWSQAFPLIV